MKGKNFLGVIFLLTLISSAVFGYVAENSCQGFAEISTISQPASDCENADLHRGSSLQNFNGMSGALYCPKHGKKKCGQCAPVITAEEYGYLPQDWRRVTRATYTHDGQRCKHGYGYGHGRGHVCDEIPGHGNGHDRNGQNDEAVYVTVYENQDESHEYQVTGNDGTTDQGLRPRGPQARSKLELIREFISGPGVDDIESTKYRGRSLALLKDALGSTIALTNRGGHAVAKIGYDAWGSLVWPDKPGHSLKPCDDKDVPDWLDRFENGRTFGQGIDPWHFGRQHGKAIVPYLYAGRRFDQFAGQYFNRNRYYSPKVGRFTSKDPIGFRGGLNLYGYVNNNPLIYTDPFGLTWSTITANKWKWTDTLSAATHATGQGLAQWNIEFEMTLSNSEIFISAPLFVIDGTLRLTSPRIQNVLRSSASLFDKFALGDCNTTIPIKFGLEFRSAPVPNILDLTIYPDAIANAGGFRNRNIAMLSYSDINAPETLTVAHELGHRYGFVDGYDPDDRGTIMWNNPSFQGNGVRATGVILNIWGKIMYETGLNYILVPQ